MIQFIKKRRLWYSFINSYCYWCSMVSNYVKFNHVFNLGIDFTGGTSIILKFQDPVVSIEEKLRMVMIDLSLDKHSIQTVGSDSVLIKTQEIGVDLRNQLFRNIETSVASFEVMEVDIIGPSIGDQLRKTSLWILLAVSVAILLYNSWRFEFVFGFASIVALIHDVLLVLSFSAIFQLEVNTAYVAALLTVLGYSINDTIVIFDRIREGMRGDDTDEGVLSKETINQAINAMLSRSVHTTLTTSMVGCSLCIWWHIIKSVFNGVVDGVIDWYVFIIIYCGVNVSDHFKVERSFCCLIH